MLHTYAHVFAKYTHGELHFAENEMKTNERAEGDMGEKPI
jgi:hypothetical protein